MAVENNPLETTIETPDVVPPSVEAPVEPELFAEPVATVIPPVMQAPVTPVVEPVTPVAPVVEPVVQEVTAPVAPKVAPITPEEPVIDTRQERIKEFNELVSSGARTEELADFARKNTDISRQMGISIKNTFQTKQNLDFNQKYATESPENLYAAVQRSEVIVGSKQYNNLPAETRQRFEAYKAQKDITALPAERKESLANDMPVIQGNVEQRPTFYSMSMSEAYDDLMQSPEIQSKQAELEPLNAELANLADDLEFIEQDIIASAGNTPINLLRAEIGNAQREVSRTYNRKLNTYNAKLATLQDLRKDAEIKLSTLQYDNTQARLNYTDRLNEYNTNRARMDTFAIAEFEQENKLLAEQRNLDNNKALAIFNQELKSKDMSWGELVDDNNGNLVYIKDGKEINVLSWLWKPLSTNIENNTELKTFQNDDDSITALLWNKDTNSIQQSVFWATSNGNINYISSIWSGEITSRWWIHDNFAWLDIDWNIGDPVYSPQGWKVLQVQDFWDKAYWKSVVVQFDDGKVARFSHLDQFNGLEVWDYSDKDYTFNRGAILGTMGNTGYVIPWDWWDGSHLDLTIAGMNWYQVEEYLNTVTQTKTTEQSPTFFNDNFKVEFAARNNWELWNSELNTILSKNFWGSQQEFNRQANLYSQKIEADSALPVIDAYIEDLEFLRSRFWEMTLLESLKNPTQWSRFLKWAAAMWFWDAGAVLANVKNKVSFNQLVELKADGATFGSLTEKEYDNIWSSTEIWKLTTTSSTELWEQWLSRLINNATVARNKITNNNPFVPQVSKDSSDNEIDNYLSQ